MRIIRKFVRNTCNDAGDLSHQDFWRILDMLRSFTLGQRSFPLTLNEELTAKYAEIRRIYVD